MDYVTILMALIGYHFIFFYLSRKIIGLFTRGYDWFKNKIQFHFRTSSINRFRTDILKFESTILSQLNTSDLSDRTGLNECGFKCIVLEYINNSIIKKNPKEHISIYSEFPLCKSIYRHGMTRMSEYMKQSEKYNIFSDLIMLTDNCAHIIELKYVKLSRVMGTINKKIKTHNSQWRPSLNEKSKLLKKINPINIIINLNTDDSKKLNTKYIGIDKYCDYIYRTQLIKYIEAYKDISSREGKKWKYHRNVVIGYVIVGIGNTKYSKSYK